MILLEVIRAVSEAPEIQILDANGNKLPVDPEHVRVGMTLILLSLRNNLTFSQDEIPGFHYHHGCLTWDGRELVKFNPQLQAITIAILKE